MKPAAGGLTKDVLLAVVLCAAKAAGGAYVLRLGFSHVSDDDYARVVIAQLFAHHPKLDPSGTSWLPLPFWIQGAVMLAFGRSLEVARTTALVLGALSILPPFFAARAVGASRLVAALGALAGGLTAWNAWLGVATVPEAIAGSLAAAGAIVLVRPRHRLWGALCLLAAALSRYEAWPLCAVYGAVCLRDFARTRGRGALVAAAVACAGPALWMAWNAAAHGDALHFFARVSRFHERVAGGDPLIARIALYPAAFFEGAPEIALLGGLAALGLFTRRIRARWGHALLCAGALLAFLVVGNVRGGAPTHHPERALLPIWWIFAFAGVEVFGRVFWFFAGDIRKERTFGDKVMHVLALAVFPVTQFQMLGVAAWLVVPLVLWPKFPGASASEDRAVQLSRGAELREQRVPAIHVYPCAYEHFALIAAYGAPERVTSEPPAPDPSASCPRLEVTQP